MSRRLRSRQLNRCFALSLRCETMADQEKRGVFFANLKASLESFFFAAKRLSKSALAPLGPVSEPCCDVDEDQLRRLGAKLQRVRAALRDAERLGLAGPAATSRTSSRRCGSRPCAPPSSLWAGELYGREGDLQRLLELLLSEDCGSRVLTVMSVVGMGGVGKTTYGSMAQGFLQHQERLQPEDVRRKYFDDLVGRCFFQESPFYDAIEGRYEMHDFFHALAQSIAEKECARIDPYKYSKRDYVINNRESIRHSSVLLSLPKSDITIEGQLFHGQDLRSLLIIKRTCCETDGNSLHVKIPSDLFFLLECLRALDLSNTDISQIPESIGNLIHLRYLGLKNTKLKRIPESVCGLLNLQTLDLKHSYYLNKLPRGIRYLVNLRHLELPVLEYPSISIPSELELLTGLQTLNAFSVADNSVDCGIGGLRYLVNLSGELHISGLMNVHHVQDAVNANMRSKTKLHKLVLKWWSLTARLQHLDAHTSCMVLDKLQPHPNLEELIVSGYCGDKFPPWLGECCFVKLVKVILEGCENCDVLPSLGQLPRLKHLVIQQMEKVRIVGREFISHISEQTQGFPALETLDIRKMYDLEIWDGVEDGDFPCLRDLNVSGCSKLRKLPQFGSLINLRIQSCEQICDLPILPSLKYLKLEGFDKMMHLPQLPNLPLLEILEVSCCKKLSSIGQLEHLEGLQLLKITKCPMLQFARDDPLPAC